MAIVKIGSVQSLGKVESYTVTPDGRQTKVQVVDGVVVQDMGIFSDGMTFSFSTTFLAGDFKAIVAMWENRQKFTFTDTTGEEYANCRIVIKTWQPLDGFERNLKNFEQMAYKVSCEVWRV